MRQQNSYAPRLRFSYPARMIRVGAVLIAFCMVTWFVGIYSALLNDAFSFAARMAYLYNTNYTLELSLAVAIYHTLLLIPLWRCYLLRRWACVVAIVFAIGGLAPCIDISEWAAETLRLPPLTLIPGFWMLCIIIMAVAVKLEWRNLKAGF